MFVEEKHKGVYKSDLSQIIDEAKIAAKLQEIAKELRKLPNKKGIEEKYIKFARLNIMQLGT